MMKVAIVVLSAIVCTLGATSNELGWRIVGGGSAEDGQFPYQVSLRSYGYHTCGGSILDQFTILCAAHCVEGQSTALMTIVTGSNKLNQGGDVYKVANYTAHEDYFYKNDISIIKLSEPIKYNDNVMPIELMQENICGDEDCVLSGWGTTSFPGSTPNDLQWIKLKTLSVEDCAAKVPGTIETELCTLTKKGEGACHGDSGGPLVAGGKQIGIVSRGDPCALGSPDIFTRVYSFLDWIEKNR